MTLANYILLSCLTLVTSPLFAQEPSQPERIELDLDYNNTTAEVFSLPDSSLLLYTKIDNGWTSEATFEFTRYDHQLKKVWSKIQKIDDTSDYIYHFAEEPYLYIAFDKEDKQQYYFLKIELATGKSTLTEVKIPTIDSIEEFRVLDGQFFVLANDKKDLRPVLLHLDPETGTSSPLPSVYGDESFFSDLLADPEQGRADAVLLESNGRVSHLQTKSFSPSGDITGTYFTPPQRDKLLQRAEISAGDSLTKLLVGAYGNNSVYYSTGFFTMPLQHSTHTGLFYSLLDLKNSLSHLKPREEKRIRRREQKRIDRRKAPGLKHQLLLHNLIPTPNGHILAAEVYTSRYDNIQNSAINLPQLPVLNREEIYKHTQVLVVAFNKNGELLWDNSFKLDDISTTLLVPTVEVAAAPDGRVIVALPDEEDIIYKVMNSGTFTKEKSTLELKGSSEGDKILGTSEHGVISWYGSSFAAFGFHRVRSAARGVRNVFYINKITF